MGGNELGGHVGRVAVECDKVVTDHVLGRGQTTQTGVPGGDDVGGSDRGRVACTEAGVVETRLFGEEQLRDRPKARGRRTRRAG
jgi:hypothetical protein